MNSATTFQEIGEHETPPDFDPAYVAARPGLKALLATAPERAHAAMVYIYQRGAAKAAAEAQAKASLSTQELVDLAAMGDDVAAQILAVRAPENTGPQTGEARGGFTAKGRDVIRRMGFDPDQIEAGAAAELAAQQDPAAQQAELARMGKSMGVSQGDIQKYGTDAGGKS